MSSVFETIKENPKAVLPDQDKIQLADGQVWVPGAYEGTLLRSSFDIKQHVWTNWVCSKKVRLFILEPSDENMKTVEDMAVKYSAISLSDPVISFLSRSRLPEDRISKAGLRLLKESSSREAVKLGIALLGRTHDIDAAKDVETASYCEEFTLYGAVSLKNMLPQDDADEALMRIAQKVSGWGKISLMYELNYEKEDIRAWIVKYGCENDIGLPYLANVCAIKGKMASYMENLEKLDADEFKGICNIFRGLLNAGKDNDGIYEYPEAVKATRLFRELIKKDPAQMSEASDFNDQLPIT